jgi:hypothetical protein
MSNRPPGAQFFQTQPISGDFRWWSFDETLGAFVETNQRFNLLPQLPIIATGFGKKSRAPRRPSIQRLLQQFIYLLPAFRSHVQVSGFRFQVSGFSAET